MAYPRIGRRFEVGSGAEHWSGYVVINKMPLREREEFVCYCNTCQHEHLVYTFSLPELTWLDQDDPAKMTRAEAEEYLWSLTRKS